MDSGDIRDLFAMNLRRLRHDRRVSQDELADVAGMSRSYLAMIETGRYHVSIKIIGKLSNALNVEPAEFLAKPSGWGRS